MKKTRRDFIKQSGMAAAAIAATSALSPSKSFAGLIRSTEVELPPDDTVRALMMTAINTAKSAGASYSDVRIGRYRDSIVFTREQQIVQTADVDNVGAGVRALVDGTWGFGASKNLTTDGVAAAAREAVAIAKANRIARDQPVQLTPVAAYPNATWTSSFKIDPFTIPIEQRADLLLKANAEALKVKGVKFVNSGLLFVKEDRNFASTEGSVISQTIVRVAVPFTITAVAPDNSDFQTRSNVVAPAGRGWEYVLEQDLVGNAGKWAEEAVQKLSAKSVEVGRYDLVLHPTHLWLTIHESIAHPTELDRALGYEANYAGTSFVAPPEKMLGKFRYGPDFMNIQGDRSQEGGCGTIGYDDEGREARYFPHHQERNRQRLPDDARAGELAQVVVRLAGETGTVAWMLERGLVGNRAVPADAQCLATPRREGHQLRGHNRRHRSRDRDRRQRLVLDRPAALQRPVRRTGFPRDQGRKDRRPAQGRRVPDAHSRFLELDGHDRRTEELLHGRRIQRR